MTRKATYKELGSSLFRVGNPKLATRNGHFTGQAQRLDKRGRFSKGSDDSVTRPLPSFGTCPGDISVRILDVAGFAVQAIGRIEF